MELNKKEAVFQGEAQKPDGEVNRGEPGREQFPLGENEEPGISPDLPLRVPKINDYRSFTGLLNEHEVPYCIDSGVLLGLMREGKLLHREKDIDLQMWAEDEDHLLELLPAVWEMGYTVTIWLYRGLVIQYRFLREGNLPVHIMLFRRFGSWAWCPAGEGAGPPYPAKLTRRFYHYFVVARKNLRERLIATEVTRWPWKARRRVGTWWVPARFFERKAYHPLFEGYIPLEWESYLSYRYGNWRVPPTKKWNIWAKDGALKKLRPEKMVDLSVYQPWKGATVLKAARKKTLEEK